MIARLFPITKDLLTYDKSTLYSDLIAGLSIAVIVIPQGLAYAMIAGLPPIYGLYAALCPPVHPRNYGNLPTPGCWTSRS